MKIWFRIVILFFAFFINIIVLSNADIKENTISNLNIKLDLKDSGDVNVTEIIEGNFYNRTEMYHTYNELQFNDIDNLEVQENGKKYENELNWHIENSREIKKNKFCLQENIDGIEIVWGIGEPGYHKYILKYTIKGIFQDGELNLKIWNSDFCIPQNAQIVCKGNFDSNSFACLKNAEGNVSVKNKEIKYDIKTLNLDNVIIYLNYKGIDNSKYKENIIRIKSNDKSKVFLIFKRVILILSVLIFILVLVIEFKFKKTNYEFFPF